MSSRKSSSRKSTYSGSRNRPSVSNRKKFTQKRRPISLGTTTIRNRPNKYINNLNRKFRKIQQFKSDIALEKAKEIIEKNIQNNKGSLKQGKIALDKALKYWRSGDFFLGNCYFLLSMAIFSLNVGKAPRPSGTQMGGPINLGFGTSATADTYEEWKQINKDIHELPIGYGSLERRMRRAYNKSRRKKLKTIEESKGGRRKKTKKKTKKKTRKKYRK